MKALIALIAAGVLTYPTLGKAAEPEQIVDAMQALAGKSKNRLSGAKGQCIVGTFTPTAEAKGLTKSAAFAAPSKVVGRFAVGGGNPKVADGTKTVNRSFSFRIDEGGKSTTEFVMVNAPINFVKSPEQMLAFLQARAPGADGKPDPEKIKAFAEANPETTLQGKYIASKPIPASWVGVAYWGIHAYTVTNADGKSQLVKIKMVPSGGEVGLTDDEAKAKPADFLVDELNGRLTSKAPAGFDLVAILGQPGDASNNATQRWADEDARPTVKLGTLTVTGLEKNDVCDGQIFDPTNLADGLAGPKDDPLFAIRQPAYAIAITRRL